ncbi:MAG: transposase [Oscillospiraceae bacterium]|jgi:REP element-mobilizing transposase RayT|nr:transposase [Oscillospiraceae bacterium]
MSERDHSALPQIAEEAAMIEIPPKLTEQPPANPNPTPPTSIPPLGPQASTPTKDPQTPNRTPQPPSPTKDPQPPNPQFQGWHSRGYLSHFDSPNTIQSITIRLADSVPASVISAWKEELHILQTTSADDSSMAKLRDKIEKYEDARYGNCYLRNPQIAEVVRDALFHFDGKRYRLLEWCIMPNHVHVMIEVLHTDTTSKIVHSWKSFTANRANAILGRSGSFWMPDYFDRYIRDERHFNIVRNYIRNNPVKAGLVKKQSDWEWGSAGKRRGGG